MSFRITQSMVYAQSLRDIHRNILGSVVLQEQVASGRRINRPSDDAAGALRILPLHAEVLDLTHMIDNVGLAREALNTGAAALQDGSSLLQRLRELTVQGANGTLSQTDRARVADEVDQLLKQMVGLGNSKRGGRHLFSGSKGDSETFTLIDDAGGTRVRYNGDLASVSIEVAPGMKTPITIPGNSIFQSRERGATTIEGTTGARPSGATDSGIGFDNLLVTFAGLASAPSTVTAGNGTTTALGNIPYTFTAVPPTLSVGGGPAVAIPATNANFTTSDGRVLNLSVSGVPATLTGTLVSRANLSIDGGTSTVTTDFTSSTVQVHNSFDGTVLNLDVTAMSRTGQDLVKYTGTFDVFTTLISVRDVLRNEIGASNQTVSTRLTALLGEVEGAHDDVLAGVQGFGHRSASMDLLINRMQGMKDSARESLSAVEDTDIADSIVAFNQQQLTYQAALQVGGRILSTSLLTFLR